MPRSFSLDSGGQLSEGSALQVQLPLLTIIGVIAWLAVGSVVFLLAGLFDNTQAFHSEWQFVALYVLQPIAPGSTRGPATRNVNGCPPSLSLKSLNLQPFLSE
jgi:hypothetical protein